ncbi:ankyrin repeat domain-containing protein [Candidatus Dependentiae bacterium]|nr:ankyrin repeat domain-containing protein [Candidatus Dependentiae bacterium]
MNRILYSLTLLYASSFCFYSVSMDSSAIFKNEKDKQEFQALVRQADRASAELKIALSNALIKVVKFSEPLVLESLLRSGADVNVFMDSLGNRPIHYAAITNNKEMMDILLNYGAEVKVVNAMGDTPLHYAAVNNNGEVMELLSVKGADWNSLNQIGKSAFHMGQEKHQTAFLTNINSIGTNK